MAPDYSQFSGKVPIAAKVGQHTHLDSGDVHLTIEVIAPDGYEHFLEAIRRGFDLLLKKLTGSDALYKESFEGGEAHLNDIPLEDYYNHVKTHPEDSN